MELRSDRRYGFAADRDALWAAITAVEDFPRWWPWLRGFDAEGVVAGDLWRCTVQPPLPYVMRFTVRIEEVIEPRLIRATVAGDVVGTARLQVEPRAFGCEARLTSTLSPDRGFLSALALVGRPLVRYGHDWVLDTGARQFHTRALTR